MEFDELLITTGVDALVRLVKEKKRIELSIASQLLDIPPQTLEEWGRILEEEGIIKIEYSLTKIFFLWVEPTAEQVATEKAEFYEERKGIEQEIKSLKATIVPEIANLETLKTDFSQFYDKLYPKLVELEKTIDALSTKDNAAVAPYIEKIRETQNRLNELEANVTSIKAELEDVNKQIMSKPGPNVKSVEKFESMKSDFEEIKKEFEELREKSKAVSYTVPKEMPQLADIRKKFELLKTEFNNVKKLTVVLREDFKNMRESSELLKSIGSSITKYEEEIHDAKKDVGELSKALTDIKNRSSALAEKVKEQSDVLDRFADSIDIAKNILTKFPSQDEFVEKLDDLTKTGNDVQERLKVMDTLLSSFSAPNALVVKFERLNSEINSKLAEMEKEAELLTKTVDEENTAYATFQRIKERAAVSLAAYNSQLKDINAEILKLKSESAAAEEQLAKSLREYGARLGQKDMREVIKMAEGIKEKKELLDQISVSVDTLSENADNLNKRLTLLAKEAALLEIRTGGDGGAPTKTEGEIRQQLMLSKDEEAEFRKKREELRDLIRKLWEEG